MRRRRRVSIVAVLAVGLAGCSARQHGAAVLAPDTPAELMPHGDGDRFVYVYERSQRDEQPDRGVQVETVVTAAMPGEFDVTLVEDGRRVSRSRFRDDGHTVVELSQESAEEGLELTFAPPLPVLELPLNFAARSTKAVAIVRRTSDGARQGTLHAEGSMRAAPAAAHSRVGDYDRAVALHLERRFEGTKDAATVVLSITLAPGVGEVHSEETAIDGSTVKRELVCATIGGHTIGDCSSLPAIVNQAP